MARIPPKPHWTIPDSEHPFDGTKLTMGQRFAAERKKFEAREGITLLKAFEGMGVISPQRLRAIEEAGAPIHDKLGRYLVGMRLDVHFILYGERTLTDAEQHVRDVMRLVSKQDRNRLLALAESMTLHIKEVRDAYDEIVYLADEEGNRLGPTLSLWLNPERSPVGHSQFPVAERARMLVQCMARTF